LADAEVPAAGAAPPAKSDLPVRVASAVVMLVIAGAAIWRGGLVLQVFVALIGLGIFAEYVGLAAKIAPDPARTLAAACAP
jgi:phosphatidate cytidylyltransferase